MSIRIELIHHYPWLPSIGDYYSNISNIHPIDFIETLFTKYPFDIIEKRVTDLFNAAFENLEQISRYKGDELNVFLYILIKVLLFALDNKAIMNRIANLYSKINYDELIKENDANLYDICQDLDLNILYYEKPVNYGINITKDEKQVLQTNFRIHFSDYLLLAASLKDEYRKLINNPLYEGYVFIQKRNLIRLLQEHIRKKIIPKENRDKKNVETFKKGLFEIEEFKKLYDIIIDNWEKKKEVYEYQEFTFAKGADLLESFPPCLKEVLLKAREGQNLTHNERLFLVFLLHALEYPLEKIIEIFSTLPDFNRETTLYQVNFALNKKYSPHKCETLKSYKFCMAAKYKDELCTKGYYSKKMDEQRSISHPMSYIRIKQYRKTRSKQTESKKDSET